MSVMWGVSLDASIFVDLTSVSNNGKVIAFFNQFLLTFFISASVLTMLLSLHVFFAIFKPYNMPFDHDSASHISLNKLIREILLIKIINKKTQ